MAKEFILFDVDGTLVYSNSVDSRSFAETYQSIYGEDFPSIDWQVYPHVTDHTIFGTVIRERFDREVKPGEIEHFQNRFVDLLQEKRGHTPEEFKEVPGAKAMVDHLLAEGYGVGIATGGWSRPAKLKLRHVEIPVESLIFSAADNQVTREGILQKAIDEAQVAYGELERVVYIGDAIWDVRTTRNMGLDFVGLRLQGDLEALTEAGAAVVIQDFNDQGAFLQSIKQASPPKSLTS